jgi:hypothetical protein
MHKIIISFFPPLEHNAERFQNSWQKFMGLAEKMPKLRRETVSDVQKYVFAHAHRYGKIHELYFDTRVDLDAALNSAEGQAAGKWLHEFTVGRFSLVIAEHKEALPDEFVKKEKDAE